MPILVVIEYISIANQNLKYQDIALTAVMLGIMYLSLRYDLLRNAGARAHCGL